MNDVSPPARSADAGVAGCSASGTGSGRFAAVAGLLVVTLPAIAGSAHATGIQSEPAPLAFESDLEQGNANVVVASTPTDGRLVTTAAAEDIQPALSPSPEGRLAFASDSDGNYDIYA